jgi:hypothetical protein
LGGFLENSPNNENAHYFPSFQKPPPERKMRIEIGQYSGAGSGWRHGENPVKSMITDRKRT